MHITNLSSGISIFVVAMLLLTACNGPVQQNQSAQPADSVYVDTLFTRFFARDCCGVTGSDGFYSVPLPDGRVVWIFGDSFLGTVNPDGTRERCTPVFIRNAFGVQQGDSLRSLYQVIDGWESSLVIPPDAVKGSTFSEDSLWYWPGDGLVEDGKLKVFMSSFYQADTGNWGFRWTGTSMATFSLPDITLEQIDPIGYPGEKEIHWGHAICDEAPDYTYIYGAENETKYPYVARAPKGTILAPWEFWDGTGWITDPAKAQPMIAFSGSEQFSVFRLGDRYLLLTGGGPFPFTSLYASTSDNPYTDWSAPKKLTDLLPLHSGSNLFAYNPVAHPQFTENGELLVSYCVNSFDLNELFQNAANYRPVFIRLPVKMIP